MSDCPSQLDLETDVGAHVLKKVPQFCPHRFDDGSSGGPPRGSSQASASVLPVTAIDTKEAAARPQCADHLRIARRLPSRRFCRVLHRLRRRRGRRRRPVTPVVSGTASNCDADATRQRLHPQKEHADYTRTRMTCFSCPLFTALLNSFLKSLELFTSLDVQISRDRSCTQSQHVPELITIKHISTS